jgi:hypothetical protein
MPLLRSHQNAWRFAEIEPEARDIRQIPIWRTLAWRNVTGDGWYAKLDSDVLALYRNVGALYLQHAGTTLVVDEHLSSELLKDVQSNVLRVFKDGSLVYEIRYKRPNPWPPLERDLTAGVDDEQMDFGLFVHRVITDPARRGRIATFT